MKKTFEKILLTALALLLALALPLSLTGCKKKPTATVEEDGKEEEQSGETQQPANLPDDVDHIGAVLLENCVIVTKGTASVAETRVARLLQQQLATVKNINLPIYKSTSNQAKEAAGKILVGTSLCQKARPEGPNDFEIAGNGNTMEIAANSSYGYESAFAYLKRSVFSRNKALAVNDDTELTGRGVLTASREQVGEVRMMINNVYGGGDPTPMNQRMEMLADLYKTYSPDVLGLQEFHDRPRAVLYPLLMSAGYTEVRYTDSDSQIVTGKSTPLFYKADRLDLLDCGYMLYTDAPDLYSSAYQSLVSPYASMEELKYNDYSKSITWGIFRVKATGHVFLAASTHLFYQRPGTTEDDRARDALWRRAQAALAKELIFAAADDYLAREGLEAGSMTVLLGGDINAIESTEPQAVSAYNALTTTTPSSSGNYTAKNAMNNTNTLVPESECIKNSTNHHKEGHWDEDYLVFDEPDPSANRNEAYVYSLDYIFVDAASVRKSRIDVKYSAAVFDTYAMLATDHCPVFIDFDLA